MFWTWEEVRYRCHVLPVIIDWATQSLPPQSGRMNTQSVGPFLLIRENGHIQHYCVISFHTIGFQMTHWWWASRSHWDRQWGSPSWHPPDTGAAAAEVMHLCIPKPPQNTHQGASSQEMDWNWPPLDFIMILDWANSLQPQREMKGMSQDCWTDVWVFAGSSALRRGRQSRFFL